MHFKKKNTIKFQIYDYFFLSSIATREEEEKAPETSKKEETVKSLEEDAFTFWERERERVCVFWCGLEI